MKNILAYVSCILFITVASTTYATTDFTHCNVATAKDTPQVQYKFAKQTFERGNYEWAWPLFLDAAKQCHPEAIEMLGLMAWNGLHVPKDAALASSLFKKAAQLGAPRAQLLVGFWYKKAEFGLSRDLKKARDLFQRSFEQGNAEAGEQLAHAYFFGWGDEPSVNNAVETYLQTDFMGGTPYNSMMLGLIYAMGIGVSLNDTTSIMHYKNAIRAGAKEAASGIALVYELNDMHEAESVWRIVDDNLNGTNNENSTLSNRSNQNLSRAQSKKIQNTAERCIASNYQQCPWPDLSKVRFKSLRALQTTFNSFGFQERSAIQYHLRNLGNYAGAIDGIWGQNTADGVVAYAKSNNIPTRNFTYLFAKILGTGPVPKFSNRSSSKPVIRSEPKNRLLTAILGGVAMGSGYSGFTSGLAGYKPRYKFSGRPIDQDDFGFRNLNVNGKQISCFYFAELNTYSNCM